MDRFVESTMTSTLTRPLRAVLVGAGRIAEEHLKFVNRSSNASLAGVCDLDLLLANRAVRGTSALATNDLARMLADLGPDVVHVLTPPRHHESVVLAALASGVSKVVVEKPAALDLVSTERIVAAVQEAGGQLTEDHNYRFNAPVLALVDEVESGRLGLLREVTVRMSMPLSQTRYRYPLDRRESSALQGEVLGEFLPHLAYLMLAFLPESHVVSNRWGKTDPSTNIEYDAIDAVVEQAGTSASGRILFSSDVAPDTTTVTVHGSKGWAEADLQNPHMRVSRPRAFGPQLSPLLDQLAGGVGLARAAVGGFSAKLRGPAIYSGIATFLEHTYDAWQEGAVPPVTHDDVVETARLVEELALGAAR